MHDRSVSLLFLLLLADCFRGGQAALISSRARRIAAASRSIVRTELRIPQGPHRRG